MPPDSLWSDKFNNPEVSLNLKGIGWKNFMSKCLLETQIYKEDRNNEKFLNVDPNVVMNVRHQLAKESAKVYPRAPNQIKTEALKILREENHNKQLKQKEMKLVKTEIVKLRQILENHRLIIQKKLEETSDKSEVLLKRSKTITCQRKLQQKLKHDETLCKMNSWISCSFQTPLKTEIKLQNCPPKDGQISLAQHECSDETSESVSCRKGSMVDDESDRENEHWSDDDDGKSEIMEKFFENEKEEFQNHLKEEEESIETAPVPRSSIYQKSIKRVTGHWKNYTQSNLKTENKIKGHKIENFLLKLKETKVKDENGKILIFNRRERLKMWEKGEKDKETDEKLKKLMQEVKSSQKELNEKVRRVKTAFEFDTKFLSKMEERKNERTKRREEFEERKRKLKQEKEIAERQSKEEQKQKEEEEKRKKLNEIKEKRRLEEQKKEEQKLEREKLKMSMDLATAHYRIYLQRSYGLRPWIKLIKTREWQQQQAKEYFEGKLKQNTLNTWIFFVQKEMESKLTSAEKFYQKILKKKYLLMWLEHHKKNITRSQVAYDWCDLKITEKCFKKWLKFTKSEQTEYKIKEEMAELRYQRKLQLKCIEKLKNYPLLKKLEQEKERRKRKWRQKVKELLPDYEPVSNLDDL